MGEDELLTVQTLKEYRQVIDKLVQEYNGRVVDSPGDNVLAEFGSLVDAVECAAKIQEELEDKNANLPVEFQKVGLLRPDHRKMLPLR